MFFVRKAAVWPADAENPPLAFAVHVQARAVDDQVDLAGVYRNVNVDAEFCRPFLK